MAKILIYISYAELHNNLPSTLDDFRARLSQFSRIKVLHICSAINAILKEDEGPHSRKAHDTLVREVFARNTAERLLKPDENVKFVFHRQQQLFMMKEALLNCSDDGKIPVVPADEFGDLFLMASDHLPLQTAKPETVEDKFVWLAANLLPVQEASAFNDFDLSIIRSHLMLFETLPRLEGKPYYDIPALFEGITGMSLLTFQSLIFGALTKFLKFDVARFVQNPRHYSLQHAWFASTRVSSAQVAAFLTFVSSTPDELAAAMPKFNLGPNDYTAFRDKPLFRDGDSFFLFDLSFLAEKIETAPFWTVHDSLGRGERDELHSFWGRVFECYGTDLLERAIDNRLNVLFRRPMFDSRPNEEVCDAILVCGDSAAFIEFKGATFTSRAKYGNDATLLRCELDRKLVSDDRPQAVEQLCRSIQATCRRTNADRIRGLDLRKITTIFPVVVTRDDVGSTVGVNAFLNYRFQERFDRNTMAKTVTPLFCLSSGDLERLTNYLPETKLTDILEAHYRVCRRKGRYLSEPIFATDGNKLLARSEKSKPRLLTQAWEELSNRMVDQLGLTPEKDVGEKRTP
jgi:hypothetical protein